MDQKKAGRALAPRLFDLVGPPSVVGEDLAAENGRVLETGIVDQGDDDLSLRVEAGVVVPAELGCYDAVADEHQLATRGDAGVVPHRPEDIVVLPLEGHGRGRGHLERRRRGERDDGYPLVIGAAVSHRLETEAPELGPDVFLGEDSAPGSRPPAFQRIVRQKLQMASQRLRAQRRGDPHSRARLLGRQDAEGKEGDEDEQRERRAHGRIPGRRGKCLQSWTC